MSELPKLKVKWHSIHPREEVTYDFKQAESSLPFGQPGASVLLEGQWTSSYEKLTQLAAQDKYKNREFLQELLVPMLGGG